MGILPLQFKDGENAESLGLTGHETYDIEGVKDSLAPAVDLNVTAHGDGDDKSFTATCRIDSDVELEYYKNGGVLQLVLRRMLTES